MSQVNKKDMWAMIPMEIESSPQILMKQQADLLQIKTKKLIKAEVSSGITSMPVDNAILEGVSNHKNTSQNMIHYFYLIVPKLKYRYELFSVIHGATSYPASIDYDSPLPKKVKNEAEFEVVLANILGSEKTGRILASLLAQAKS
jgi:hypothetical protein